MRAIIRGFGCSAIFGLLLVVTAQGQEKGKPKIEKITQDQIPEKVMKAVKSKFTDPKFTAMTKETVDGKVFYDLEFTANGKKGEMDINEDGTIINVEREITAKDLPKPVAKAVREKYPKAKLTIVLEAKEVKGTEEIVEGYEITLITADGKTIEASVSPDGKKIDEAVIETKEKK